MEGERWLDAKLRRLYPGYFALVMATGIVSNGFYLAGQRTLSLVLLLFNLVAYPLLVGATVMRAFRFGRELLADLLAPRLVFTFFTIVAGSDVLGVQLHLRGYDHVAVALWLFALCAWVLLGYFSFAVLAFDESETGVDVVHGGWLIAIVGTESLVVLGTPLATRFGGKAVELLAHGQFGKMVANHPPDIVPIPLGEVVGQIKTVPLDYDLLKTARAIGIGFGD